MTHDYLYAGDAIAWTLDGFDFQQVSPVERFLRPSPRLLLGPVPRDFGAWHYGDRQAPSVGVFRIDDVTLETDRILRRGSQTICIEQNGLHPQAIEQARPLEGPIRTSRHGEMVLLCGPSHQMYGHWLVDFLPRLLLLPAVGLDLARQAFLLPADLAPFAREWLRLLGIGDEQITFYDPASQRCLVGRAIVPTAFRGDGRTNSFLAGAMATIRHAAIGDQPCPGERRLFVSRRRWGNRSRSLGNTEQIEQALAEDGFEIVFPEELSLKQQVRLFAEAGTILGEYGSGLHNSVFSPAGTRVIALRGTAGHPGFLQSGLCAALHQEIGYVFGDTDTGSAQRFEIAAAELRLLRELLAEPRA